MINHLRKKLVVLFALFIILFFTGITILYLSISYQALYDKSTLTFKQNALSIYITISNNRVLDTTFFRTFTASSYEIFVSDGDNLITFESDTPFANPNATFNEVLKQSATIDSDSGSFVESKNFVYRADNGQKYFASVCTTLNTDISIVILNSQSQLHKQFLSIVEKYAMISTLCIVFLCVLAFVFISKLLAPVAQSTEQQKQFVTAASHELRTPLTVIKSSLLAIKPNEASVAFKYYEIADSECSRMSALLGELLTLSRIDNRRITTNMVSQHIEPVLFQCYNNFEELVLNKHLEFRIELPDEPISNYCFDKNKIVQLLTILLDNALQYTEQGSITLRAYEKKNHLFLLVIDTGVGIQNDCKDKVFERFFQGNESHSNPNHFGLGLSIAKELAALHNGEITITDTSGGGTTFTVKL